MHLFFLFRYLQYFYFRCISYKELVEFFDSSKSFFIYLKKYLCIYLFDCRYYLQHLGSLVSACGIQFWPGIEPRTLPWEQGVLATGLPEKSLKSFKTETDYPFNACKFELIFLLYFPLLSTFLYSLTDVPLNFMS